MEIDKKFLDILACPKTKAALVLDQNRLISIDKETRLCYPIVDDIPVLLVEEGKELPYEEWETIMQKHGKLT